METKRLVEIAKIQTGPFGSQLHKEDYVADGTPIVTVEHLGKRCFTEQNLPKVSEEDKERLSKYTLLKGDIVFSRVGSVDRCSYVDDEHEGWMFSGRCLRVRPNCEIDGLFLYYYFCLENTKQYIRNIAVGATMPSINTKLMGEVPVVLPSLEEQQKIASILSVIDDKIEKNIIINKNLYEQAQILFNEYCLNSEKTVPFTSMIKVLGGGTPKTKEANYWNGNIPFFTPKDVGTPYTFCTEKYITGDGLSHCNSKLYPKNTTFVTARGTVGKISLAGKSMAMNQSCYALASDVLDPILVHFYTLQTVRSLKHKASGAVFDAIVTRDFDLETIPLLPKNMQNEVCNILISYLDMIHSNQHEILNLITLRDALLPQLMSGELDVSAMNI